MGVIDYYPKREGYRLTEEGEDAWGNWLSDYNTRGGCTCWQSAPCSICTHEDHPYSIEETDEYWVKQSPIMDIRDKWKTKQQEEEMSRDNIVDKSKPLTPAEKFGLKVGSKIKVKSPIGVCHFNRGDIITLVEDDATSNPYFKRCIGEDIAPFSLTSQGWEHYTEEEVKSSTVDYKSGDKVKIIGNSNGHPYARGDIVTLEKGHYCKDSEKFYWTTREHTRYNKVRECDIEPYRGSYAVKMEQSVEQMIDCVIESAKTEINQQSKGDLNMSNTQRRVVNVVLIDPDQGLPVEHSQVHDFGQIVTEDDDATTIQELIMTGDVQAKLDIHNKVRSEQIDLDILRRTGNEVKLQPVKLKNLKWIIK